MRKAEAAAEGNVAKPQALNLDIRNTSPKGQSTGNRTGESPRQDIVPQGVYPPLRPLTVGGRKATGLRPICYDCRAAEGTPAWSLQPVASLLKVAG